MLPRQSQWRRASRQLCLHARPTTRWRLPGRSYSQAPSLSDETIPPPNSHPKTIFSGIQPTGIPHLGNYLGALQRWVQLQNDSPQDTNPIYSLVDLHAITVRQPPSQLRQWKKESLAMLHACGLDPERSVVFHQSSVPAHAELMWILSCQASMGYLSRMTQWKDKTSTDRENAERQKLGLFSYPVLQAADVLVHGATHVPVGHDQAQHLEFARELAISFNHTFGPNILTPPETMISPAKRIMSLTHPTTKMSKSAPNPASRILLTDSYGTIHNKLKSALTDSETDHITYEPDRRPGVSNLLDIRFHCEPKKAYADQHELAKDLEGLSMRALKANVADAVDYVIRPIRERYEELIRDEKALDEVAVRGAEKARAGAAVTLEKVQKAVGLL